MFHNILPFANLTQKQIRDEFSTNQQKLKEVIKNSNLSTMLTPYKQIFSQVGLDCKYYVEEEFNAELKNYNDSNFSVFHINIRSLNKHHKELVTYLSLLNFKFDCICLTEIWNYNLEFYKNIFPNYVSHFEPPKGNTKIGGAGIFIKRDLKISQRTQHFNIEL